MSEEEWTKVEKKQKPRVGVPNKSNYRGLDDSTQREQDDTVILRRKAPLTKVEQQTRQRTAMREGRCQSVETGRVGQKSNYDYLHMAKLDNDHEGGGPIKKIDMTLAKKIAQARNALGWTQRDLAMKLDVHPNIVASFENGSAIHDGVMIGRFRSLLKI